MDVVGGNGGLDVCDVHLVHTTSNNSVSLSRPSQRPYIALAALAVHNEYPFCSCLFFYVVDSFHSAVGSTFLRGMEQGFHPQLIQASCRQLPFRCHQTFLLIDTLPVPN